MILAKNINLRKVMLCLLAFSAGLGIEFPLINILGNFTFFDLFLCIYASIFIRTLKLNLLSYFPVIIGVFGLVSLSYNVLLAILTLLLNLMVFQLFFDGCTMGF